MGGSMQAVVYEVPGTFAITEVPKPIPGPGAVLLRVVVAGVCGTDLHLHAGEFGPSYPLTPGHEFVGEVVELGPGEHDLVLGDRVVVDNTTACGHCPECRRGQPVFCRNGIAQGVNASGGFAEFVLVHEDRCFLVNDLDPEVAVLAEPTACVVHGLDVLALRPGSRVLLFGAGPTGLLLTQLLATSGAADLTVAAPSAHKLELAMAGGADRTVQIDRTRPSSAYAELARIAGDGFDVVIDATGSIDVLEQTIPLTRVGGTVFVYGMTAEAARWPVPSYEVFRRELTIKGSFAQQFAFDRALTMLRNGRVRPEGLITHRFPLDEYAAALDAVADSACIKAVVIPTPSVVTERTSS
jgi:D-arabinitol dehydrogenase (NADP+)